VKRHGIQKVFIAIMSATDSQIDGILQVCARSRVPCEKVRPLLPPRRTGAAEPVSGPYTGTGKVVPLTSRTERRNER
jgi:hypothetical protein